MSAIEVDPNQGAWTFRRDRARALGKSYGFTPTTFKV
jgi:hypothetical protein